jgi:probable HAF family extracellular repeat protein
MKTRDRPTLRQEEFLASILLVTKKACERKHKKPVPLACANAFATGFFIALTFVSSSVNAQTSNLIDLGVATGYAINNAGRVVLSTGIYSGGITTPLPALAGQTTPAVGATINATGQVAGSAAISAPNPPGSDTVYTTPVEFSDGTLTNLFGQSNAGSATGINSAAEIVGYSEVAYLGPSNVDEGTEYLGFIYANGTLNTLPSRGSPGIPSTNLPQSINDSGQITGIFSVQDPNNPEANRLDAYIYNYGNGTTTDLGQGAGYAINNAGQVTGVLDVTSDSSDTILSSYAFLYSNGTTANLGALPGGKDSTGYAINSTGEVVGSSATAGNVNSHAFFYNGVMIDLNTLISATDPLKPYVTLTSAVGINDSRLILANGVDSRSGAAHAYLLQGTWVVVGPAALTFAAVTVGATSPTKTVTVGNAGTSPIALGTITASTNFSIESNSCGTSLAPAAQCTVAVAYTPETAGMVTGAMTVPSGGVSYSVALSGSATVSGSIVAGAKTATVGQPLTLIWTVSAGSTCTASAFSANTAWTTSRPPFTGTVPASGKQTLTETVAGTVTYTLSCTAPGTTSVFLSTSVVWSWPPVSATISASPTTIIAGQSTTLTWQSSDAMRCIGTGGGADDNWAGTKATSGSQTVTEGVALDTSSVVLTFGITCDSTTSGLSDKVSVNVTENQAAAGSGGGGGALNLMWLALLASIFALRRIRIRIVTREAMDHEAVAHRRPQRSGVVE